MQLSKRLLTFPFRISVFKNSVEAFHKHVRVDSETSSETICPLMLPMDPITRKILMERGVLEERLNRWRPVDSPRITTIRSSALGLFGTFCRSLLW